MTNGNKEKLVAWRYLEGNRRRTREQGMHRCLPYTGMVENTPCLQKIQSSGAISVCPDRRHQGSGSRCGPLHERRQQDRRTGYNGNLRRGSASPVFPRTALKNSPRRAEGHQDNGLTLAAKPVGSGDIHSPTQLRLLRLPRKIRLRTWLRSYASRNRGIQRNRRVAVHEREGELLWFHAFRRKLA